MPSCVAIATSPQSAIAFHEPSTTPNCGPRSARLCRGCPSEAHSSSFTIRSIPNRRVCCARSTRIPRSVAFKVKFLRAAPYFRQRSPAHPDRAIIPTPSKPWSGAAKYWVTCCWSWSFRACRWSVRLLPQSPAAWHAPRRNDPRCRRHPSLRERGATRLGSFSLRMPPRCRRRATVGPRFTISSNVLARLFGERRQKRPFDEFIVRPQPLVPPSAGNGGRGPNSPRRVPLRPEAPGTSGFGGRGARSRRDCA